MCKVHVTGDARISDGGRPEIPAHTRRKPSHMYPASRAQWNPFVGCLFCCLYCVLSFQLQLKRWAKNHCERCYKFISHEHPDRQPPRRGHPEPPAKWP